MQYFLHSIAGIPAGVSAVRFTIPLILVITMMVVIITYALTADQFAADFLVSVTAVIGALAIWFEIRRSKEIAQGEFVLTLNNSYSGNKDIKELYRKLISGEPLSEDDLPNIVEYLTFFETIYLLLKRDVVKMDVINDLFAYRFFLAVNNPDIQRLELVKDDQYYRNIFRLDHLWHQYRFKNGYVDYERSKLEDADERYRDLIV